MNIHAALVALRSDRPRRHEHRPEVQEGGGIKVTEVCRCGARRWVDRWDIAPTYGSWVRP